MDPSRQKSKLDQNQMKFTHFVENFILIVLAAAGLLHSFKIHEDFNMSRFGDELDDFFTLPDL